MGPYNQIESKIRMNTVNYKQCQSFDGVSIIFFNKKKPKIILFFFHIWVFIFLLQLILSRRCIWKWETIGSTMLVVKTSLKVCWNILLSRQLVNQKNMKIFRFHAGLNPDWTQTPIIFSSITAISMTAGAAILNTIFSTS
jgi:hypothetical protein